MNEYGDHDATGLAELVRRREVTPRELAEQAITRVEATDGHVNALVYRRFDKAIAAADADLPDGPFRGVPFLLKDLGAGLMKGDPNYCGSAVVRDLAPAADHDSNVTRRFLSAGFVVLGRTNVPELGATYTTEPKAFGPTRNPRDLTRTVGGSSGGSAAAVAAGYVPAAHANDGGGSTRAPASLNGLVGLKTSRGRVSLGPEAGEELLGLSTESFVTRTVRDAARLLDVLAGYVPGDPYMAPPPARPYADEVGVDPGRLRIGAMTRLPGFETDPACEAAVLHTTALLADLGHDVGESGPEALAGMDGPIGEYFLDFVAARIASVADAIDEGAGRRVDPSAFEPLTADHIRRGRGMTAADLIRERVALEAFTRDMATWWSEDGWDLLLTPTLLREPYPLGYLDFDPADAEGSHRRMLGVAPFLPAFNITGQPGISLPLGSNEDGMPIGVQLVAAYGREDVLIRIAAQLEVAAPWKHLVPGAPAFEAAGQPAGTSS